MGYRVIGEFAAVTLGEPGGNGVVQILERGAVVPDGVHQSVLDHLVTVGQIEAEPAIDAPDHGGAEGDPSNEGDDPTGVRRGPALDVLDLAGLRELAAQRGVDLQGATRKADIIAALEAAAVS